ncbi:MAG: hypothetical protein AAF844_18935, partial [Pseudomonadota bacterium]
GGLAARFIAAVVDVPSLIPGSVVLQGVRGAATAGRLGLRVGAAAGVETAGTEALLHGSQELRTISESFGTIGASIVIGSVLGGTADTALARSSEGRQAFNRASQAIDAERRVDTASAPVPPVPAGAAPRLTPVPEDFTLPNRVVGAVKQATPPALSIAGRLTKARSLIARRYGGDLVQSDEAWAGADRLGATPSVEATVRATADRYQIDIARGFREGLTAHRDAGGGLTRTDFTERVAAAMRRDDLDADPAIAGLARSMRQTVVEPLKDEAIRMGLLPEGVTVSTAASYFTRLWDQNRIVARADEFLARLATKFEFDLDASSAAAGLSVDEIEAYARTVAEDVYGQLVRAESPTDFLSVAITRGPLKDRSLNVRDVDFEDFLVNDAEFVLSRYARVMAAETELTRRFGRADMRDQVAEINADYGRLRDAAKTEAERRSLEAERRRTIDALTMGRDLVRGTYLSQERAKPLFRALEATRTFNYVRALGDVVASSLPDVFKLTMVNGLMPVAKGALVPLIRKTKDFRLSSQRAADAAGIAEVLLNSRMMAIADIADPYARRTPVENFMEVMGRKASLFSGMMHWNQFLKEIAVYMANLQMQRGEISAARLQRLRITTADAQRIRAAMREHGEAVGDVFDARIDRWDADTARLWGAALRAEADTVIVSPGIGDRIPLVEQNWLLKPAAQFKSFALASHRKTMMVGLAESQQRFVTNALLMASMGMFVYWLKSQSHDGEVSDNPGTWLAEGIDRSGVVPLVMELNNMGEAIGAPGFYRGMGALFGDTPEPASRYR